MILDSNFKMTLIFRKAGQILNKALFIIFQTGYFLQVIGTLDGPFKLLFDITKDLEFDHKNRGYF